MAWSIKAWMARVILPPIRDDRQFSRLYRVDSACDAACRCEVADAGAARFGLFYVYENRFIMPYAVNEPAFLFTTRSSLRS